MKELKGNTTVVASVSRSAYEAVKLTLDAISESVHELGSKVGSGSAMKTVNQLLAAVHILAMDEGVDFWHKDQYFLRRL